MSKWYPTTRMRHSQWCRPLRHHLTVTRFCFHHTSGTHTSVGNSNVPARGLFFRKVAYIRYDVAVFVAWMDYSSFGSIFYFFIIGGVGLSPLVLRPLLAYCTSLRMIVEQLVEWRLAGETKYSEKTCPSATLSTTNPTWPDAGSNPGPPRWEANG
jgi:hypothetical protein